MSFDGARSFMLTGDITTETDGSAPEAEDGKALIGAWERPRPRSGTLLGRSLADWIHATRSELGLSTTRPLIGTGHQADFWHPGVAVKPIAAATIADRCDGAMWHLVVDSDAHPVHECAVPVRGAAGELRLVTASLDTAAAHPELPTGLRCPLVPPPLSSLPKAALPQVDDGLAAMHAALLARGAEPDAAMQITRAALDLLTPLLPTPPTVVRSSMLLRTSLGAAILRHMREDPRRCAETYNAAVARTHGAGTPVAVGPVTELPLWVVDDRGRRRRADARDLESDQAALLPRALLVTALVRLAAADLFIHGRGGIAYDQAMVGWIVAWLGVAPAPATLVTATLRLPLPERDEPADGVERALAQQRRLWFDPDRGDAPNDAPSSAKAALLAAIDSAPRGSSARVRAYRAMHARLDAGRERHGDTLRAANDAVATAIRHAAGRPIAMSRTWAFPFHASPSLAALAQRVRALCIANAR